MRFRPYPKIGGRGRRGAGPWVAAEKIHGAHLVVGFAGREVHFGKRKQWLVHDESFFGWQLIATELADQVRSAVRAIGAAQVVCFGELFGGRYPHPDVADVPGLAAVQTGVWYAPDLHWSPFDILVAAGDDDEGELLAFSEVENLVGGTDLMAPPVLGRGSVGELDRIALAASTAVPAVLGLPPIPGNLREGFVVRPDRRMHLRDLVAVKHKLADFDDARFDGAERFDPGHLPVEQLAGWARRLVNPARLASARSKVGADPSEVLEEVILDVAVDLESAFGAAWRDLGVDGEAVVLAEAREAAMVLRDRPGT